MKILLVDDDPAVLDMMARMLLVTSLIFALGHFATIRQPARLAVFFPSLLFGWLRYRTKGIGAGLAFHAACNVFSELLGKGFRIY